MWWSRAKANGSRQKALLQVATIAMVLQRECTAADHNWTINFDADGVGGSVVHGPHEDGGQTAFSVSRWETDGLPGMVEGWATAEHPVTLSLITSDPPAVGA